MIVRHLPANITQRELVLLALAVGPAPTPAPADERPQAYDRP